MLTRIDLLHTILLPQWKMFLHLRNVWGCGWPWFVFSLCCCYQQTVFTNRLLLTGNLQAATFGSSLWIMVDITSVALHLTESPAIYKHSSLLGLFVSYQKNKVLRTQVCLLPSHIFYPGLLSTPLEGQPPDCIWLRAGVDFINTLLHVQPQSCINEIGLCVQLTATANESTW